jgi:hypothetical protein
VSGNGGQSLTISARPPVLQPRRLRTAPKTHLRDQPRPTSLQRRPTVPQRHRTVFLHRSDLRHGTADADSAECDPHGKGRMRSLDRGQSADLARAAWRRRDRRRSARRPWWARRQANAEPAAARRHDRRQRCDGRAQRRDLNVGASPARRRTR